MLYNNRSDGGGLVWRVTVVGQRGEDWGIGVEMGNRSWGIGVEMGNRSWGIGFPLPDLEERGGRVPAGVRAHLVDLIQEQHRVARPRALQALHQAPRQARDVPGIEQTRDRGG